MVKDMVKEHTLLEKGNLKGEQVCRGMEKWETEWSGDKVL